MRSPLFRDESRPSPKQLELVQILAEHFAAHAQIPTMAHLAAQQGVRRQTIHTRLFYLEKKGLVRSRRVTEAGLAAIQGQPTRPVPPAG